MVLKCYLYKCLINYPEHPIRQSHCSLPRASHILNTSSKGTPCPDPSIHLFSMWEERAVVVTWCMIVLAEVDSHTGQMASCPILSRGCEVRTRQREGVHCFQQHCRVSLPQGHDVRGTPQNAPAARNVLYSFSNGKNQSCIRQSHRRPRLH